MKEEIKKKYIVVEVTKNTADVSTLKLQLEDGASGKGGRRKNVPTYCSGQFITVYFPELGTPEGKAYSISSAPHESTISITVKAMGVFSNRLVALSPGDSITGSLPYGFFYSESIDTTPLLMIASGIGVAPFRSMILDALKKNPVREIKLFYSIRTSDDILFEKEFAKLAGSHPNFRVSYFITREPQLASDPLRQVSHHRIGIDDILESHRHDTSEFFICGSISFVRDIWRGLHEHNIPEISIYTEAFFSH